MAKVIKKKQIKGTTCEHRLMQDPRSGKFTVRRTCYSQKGTITTDAIRATSSSRKSINKHWKEIAGD